jgi:N-acyl-L-homoserine lactone synthetase
MTRAVFLFHTTTSAIRAEKVLKKAGLEVKLVPTPRELSSDCGVALQIEAAQEEEGARVLSQAKVEADLHWAEE